MQYYYLGLTVDSPEREQALTVRNVFLDELSISMRGRMFVPPFPNLLQNPKFMKLVAFMSPCDVLITHDLTRSATNIYNLLEILGLLNDKCINIINLAFPRVNTIDYPFLYDELSELLILIQNYTVFLYCIATRTLENFDFTKVMPLLDMDKEFDSFVKHTIRSEIYSYQVTPTVSDFINYITSEESLNYVQSVLGLPQLIAFDDSYISLKCFNALVQQVVYNQ